MALCYASQQPIAYTLDENVGGHIYTVTITQYQRRTFRHVAQIRQ